MTPSGPRSERETIIRWDEENKTLEVWTASGPVARKLERLGWTLKRDSGHAMEFEAPLRCISLRNVAKSAPRGIARGKNAHVSA